MKKFRFLSLGLGLFIASSFMTSCEKDYSDVAPKIAEEATIGIAAPPPPRPTEEATSEATTEEASEPKKKRKKR